MSEELHGLYSFESLSLRLDLAQYHLALLRLIEFREDLALILDRCSDAIATSHALREPALTRQVIDFLENPGVCERFLDLLAARMCPATTCEILQKLANCKETLAVKHQIICLS
jgi:hypothetical protein